ncbi:MAG: rane protein [Pseudoduganella sp.]|jgi:uncharacterized membrane protein YedE/YeeE|nr:rane protein [Pseudoduganella sp.]
MYLLSAALSGLLFGLGLILAGMANPANVLGFLDLAGQWNPSLALVMGGALMVGLAAFPLARKRHASLLGAPMRLPTASQIDRRLVLGGLAFGIGWGLAGFCPGPALASLAFGGAKAWLFFASMLAGMGLFEVLERLRAHSGKAA